ncbi:IS110 family transposase [Streptomyces sp. CB01201]|uniref:IS110 family transposase n=1 Tax=Streptomyces sp. CB01201 TaxID=2020324 RepID=UPI000C27CB20|nr:IS110 family transposase [Streptomyces sp. CB01201]
MIYCGIDWAENHHDVALIDNTGQLLAKRRITDDAAGYRLLLDLLVDHGDNEDSPIPIAIETSRGLLVAALRQGRRNVFAINPLAASRYRDRHSVSRKKSDPGDALVLANILRTDMPMHRPLPDDSEQSRAIAVLARAQQDAIWNRQQIANQLRSLLREYYPAALDAFSGLKHSLCRAEARTLLALAPTSRKSAMLSRPQLRAALKRAGRSRGIEDEVDRLHGVFRADYPHQPQLIEDAFGKQMLALLRQLDAACVAADELEEAAEQSFRQHPDAEILLSFPGLGVQIAARVLAEIGDDRKRFIDARALKAYAGSSPVTRASGKKEQISRRWVKNDRLNHAGYLWAFSAFRHSPGAEAHYRHRRLQGDWHAAAQRHLFNRMIGQLYHCLQKGQLFEERVAFPPALPAVA